jgi:hypothetical protein
MRFFAAPREWNAEVVVDETKRRDRSAASCGGSTRLGAHFD